MVGYIPICANNEAFHWFDPSKFRSEVKRILKPNGHAVLMWNIRKETGTPFLESYEKVLCAYGTDYMKLRRQNVTENGSLDTFFGKDNYQVKTFRHSKRFDLLALLSFNIERLPCTLLEAFQLQVIIHKTEAHESIREAFSQVKSQVQAPRPSS
jgi:SAM-dependent methyltransferase